MPLRRKQLLRQLPVNDYVLSAQWALRTHCFARVVEAAVPGAATELVPLMPVLL